MLLKVSEYTGEMCVEGAEGRGRYRKRKGRGREEERGAVGGKNRKREIDTD